MLLSVSAISSAAETPAPSVLTVSDSSLALVDRDRLYRHPHRRRLGTGDASPDAWAALPGTSHPEEGFQDETIYPYYYPGDRLDRWQSGTTAKEATHCSPWAMQPRRPAAARSP